MTGLSVVVGGGPLLRHSRASSPGRFHLAGSELVAALAETRPPGFDAAAEADVERVLIEVSAFSCNYRDRGILLQANLSAPTRVTPLGSEFCARVVEVGRGVSTLSAGDRVFANNQWPIAGSGVPAGIPTNQASRRHHRLHHRQLARVPDVMTDEEAAAFTLGAQTAYAMVRRLQLSPGDAVLVTAASSSTSQFAISALRNDASSPRVLALTTSARGADAACERGADAIVVLPNARVEFSEPMAAQLSAFAADAGGFAAIIDPFHDLYLPELARFLRDEGRYISCGLALQYEGADVAERPDRMVGRALAALGLRNASFIGHCLGTSGDLDRALEDFLAGLLPVPLDSVHAGPPAPFIERSFNDRARVGKAVYRY